MAADKESGPAGKEPARAKARNASSAMSNMARLLLAVQSRPVVISPEEAYGINLTPFLERNDEGRLAWFYVTEEGETLNRQQARSRYGHLRVKPDDENVHFTVPYLTFIAPAWFIDGEGVVEAGL